MNVDRCEGLMTLSLGSYTEIEANDSVKEISLQLGLRRDQVLKMASIIKRNTSRFGRHFGSTIAAGIDTDVVSFLMTVIDLVCVLCFSIWVL